MFFVHLPSRCFWDLQSRTLRRTVQCRTEPSDVEVLAVRNEAKSPQKTAHKHRQFTTTLTHVASPLFALTRSSKPKSAFNSRKQRRGPPTPRIIPGGDGYPGYPWLPAPLPDKRRLSPR
ncbi:uncharacterized protein LOC143291580 [Babylonia areolata]|uniref:uncharacterized protein LOC143291580 n=1 Tax=Babylonia areolata TaxID=304850 RepID=UPI003FD0EE91